MLNFYRLILLSLISIPALAQVSSPLIAFSPSVVCTGVPVNFSVTSSDSILSADWSVFPQRENTISSNSGTTTTIVFSKDLNYTVTVLVSTPSGTATSKRLIVVQRTAVAAFNASLNATGFPTELVLTNYSSYAQKNVWLFSNDATADSSNNTVKHYSSGGGHTVTLIAFGLRGCNDTSSYTFRIADSSYLNLPNVFTPNWDGINDVFRPDQQGIRELHAYIFNRDGIMLYSWHKVNGYWDGRTTSGEACADGQYYVVLEATGFDERSYRLHGHVTLIR